MRSSPIVAIQQKRVQLAQSPTLSKDLSIRNRLAKGKKCLRGRKVMARVKSRRANSKKMMNQMKLNW